MGQFRILYVAIALCALALNSCTGLGEDGEPEGPPNGTEPDPVDVQEPSGGDDSDEIVDGGDDADRDEMDGGEDSSEPGDDETTVNADASRGDSSVKDAGVREGGAAGAQIVDGAIPPADSSGIGTEGGVRPPLSAASCQEAHLEPGCNDAATQDCVCKKLPDCCTVTWDLACTMIVTQKFCEPGIRECVCGPAAEGGCAQPQCCDTDWNDFCDSIATVRCADKQSCW